MPSSLERRDPYPKPGEMLGILHNECNFSVWVRQAISDRASEDLTVTCENFETQDIEILPGKRFYTPVPVLNNGCGHASKLCRTLHEGTQLTSIFSQSFAQPWREGLPVRVFPVPSHRQAVV